MIAYVLRYWPTLTETFVAREIAELRRRGHVVEVVALGRRADPRPGEAVEELVVHRPPRGLALARSALVTDPRIWTNKREIRVSWAASLLRRRGVRRVHAHFAGEAAMFARGVGERLGIPYSVTVHASDLFVPHPAVDLAGLLAAARPVVTICEHHARDIGRRFGVESRVVYCGVRPERYPQADPGASSRFVSVARDVPKKGLVDLTKAMREVPAVLRLVGDGHRHGGPGVLVGPVAADAVGAILSDAMAFVLPCRIAANGDRDGIPVAMMEAMACGVPVVTTPVSGIPRTRGRRGRVARSPRGPRGTRASVATGTLRSRMPAPQRPACAHAHRRRVLHGARPGRRAAGRLGVTRRFKPSPSARIEGRFVATLIGCRKPSLPTYVPVLTVETISRPCGSLPSS